LEDRISLCRTQYLSYNELSSCLTTTFSSLNTVRKRSCNPIFIRSRRWLFYLARYPNVQRLIPCFARCPSQRQQKVLAALAAARLPRSNKSTILAERTFTRSRPLSFHLSTYPNIRRFIHSSQRRLCKYEQLVLSAVAAKEFVWPSAAKTLAQTLSYR